jgi:GH35 family endo-1,4-beta-xylanase
LSNKKHVGKGFVCIDQRKKKSKKQKMCSEIGRKNMNKPFFLGPSIGEFPFEQKDDDISFLEKR